MYHSFDDIYRSMRLEPFQSHFDDYLSAIREARDKGASHDYLRQVFIDFARKSFRVDPVDVELEKGIKGLSRMLASAQDDLSCQVKFREWDKLLAKAYGHSVARNELFLRHTYLSLLVKILAYAALFRQRPKGHEFPDIVTGKAFVNLPNLTEEDFFCWVLSPSLQRDTLELLRGLA